MKKEIEMKVVLYTFHGDVETTSYFMTQMEKRWEQSVEDSLKSEKMITVVPIYFDVEKKTVSMTGDTMREHERLVAEGDTQFYFVTFNFAGIYGDDLWFLQKREAKTMDVNLADAKNGDTNSTNENASNKKQGTAKDIDTDFIETAKGQNVVYREENNRVLAVDAWNLTVVNILVDHPYHYHDFLEQQIEKRLDRYIQVCIDREHIAYMKRYFPMIKMGPFMPSGGTELFYCQKDRTPVSGTYIRKKIMENGDAIATLDNENNDTEDKKLSEGNKQKEQWKNDWEKRPYDIVFAATYVWPEYFHAFIDRNGSEYSAFYHSVLDEVLADHNKKLEDVMRRRLTEEVEGEISEDEMLMTLGHMQFLDYYVRYKNRERIVKMLAKAGFQIHIFGSGWQDMEWSDIPEEEAEGINNEDESGAYKSNLILHPYATSEKCLEVFSKTKFVLNVLPSFHDGAHDRIFNAMLNGAICITDSNQFLDTILVDEENALLYNWEEPEKLIEKLKAYLDGEKKDVCTQIVRNGYKLAKNHTWLERAKLLESLFSEK